MRKLGWTKKEEKSTNLMYQNVRKVFRPAPNQADYNIITEFKGEILNPIYTEDKIWYKREPYIVQSIAENAISIRKPNIRVEHNKKTIEYKYLHIELDYEDNTFVCFTVNIIFQKPNNYKYFDIYFNRENFVQFEATTGFMFNKAKTAKLLFRKP